MRLAELKVEPWNSLVYAKLRGEIDMSNAAELRTSLSEMTPNDRHGLLLDLSEIYYLDSTGIHLIHHLREDLRARGQRLVLVIPPDSPINDTLRLAGLDWSSDISDSLDAARRDFPPDSQG